MYLLQRRPSYNTSDQINAVTPDVREHTLLNTLGPQTGTKSIKYRLDMFYF